MIFSYDPTNINEYGLDRLRFECGDTFVSEPDKTACLCDEEYLTVLESSSSWKRCKLRIFETLLMRYAHETDLKIDSLDIKLSQRIDFWKAERNRLKNELEAEDIAASSALRINRNSRPPIFGIAMHDWR